MITVAPPHVVRRMRPGEVESIWQLAEAIPTAAHWSRGEYEKYGAMAQPGSPRMKALFVACTPDAIVGFAALAALPGSGQYTLENMAVAEPWRRQGIARRLLAAGLLWCRTWRSAEPVAAPALQLEVRASNHGAIAFYEKAGFAVSSRRPRYYVQPEEDALLLDLRLDTPPSRR